MSLHKVEAVLTNPFTDQKPGTSGLRKKVPVFKQANYTENFIQAILDGGLGAEKEGATLVVGGDGRYYNTEAVQLIIKISAANGVSKLFVGQGGFMSTPAVSCAIRKDSSINGGIILTASHNPGGPDQDFGIKFNSQNGGPAADKVTNKIFDCTKEIKEYKICRTLDMDINKLGTETFQTDRGLFTVTIVDPVDDYFQLMSKIFNLAKIKELLNGTSTGKPLRILVDSMHGATGPYIDKILGEYMGCPKEDLLNTNVLTDFGGCHPDPNLTYAKALVDKMAKGNHDVGAAFDGDGDRNMILGKGAFFVTPSDSLAALADNLSCIPYFTQSPPTGFARSMPTASAVDLVAKAKGVEMFEVPTGWKYFGNLMDAGRLSLCGEESFGTGSDHIREKDGIWALLAWLQVLADKKHSVEEIISAHWAKYGRNVFTRYDYEECDQQSCNLMMAYLEKTAPAFVGQQHQSQNGQSYTVKLVDNFQYTDPIDGSLATNQGIRIIFEDGSRIVFRLSGTGSSGATVRMYIDSYVDKTDSNLTSSAQVLLQPLIEIALRLSQLSNFISRDKPTVIT